MPEKNDRQAQTREQPWPQERQIPALTGVKPEALSPTGSVEGRPLRGALRQGRGERRRPAGCPCGAVTCLISTETCLQDKGLVPPCSPSGQGNPFSPKTGGTRGGLRPAPSSPTQPGASPAVSRCSLRPSGHTPSGTRSSERREGVMGRGRGARGRCRRAPRGARPGSAPRATRLVTLFVPRLFPCCIIVPFRSFLKASSMPASLWAHAAPSRGKLCKL